MNVFFITFIAVFSLWLAFEIWLNWRDRARIDRTVDKNTGIYLFFLIVGALSISGIAYFLDLWQIPVSRDFRLSTGIVIMGGGGLLRWWAVWCLGRYFRTAMMVTNEQRIITHGPYRLIRHPAYAGTLLVFLGFGFGLGSWVGLASMLFLPLSGYYYRIKVEERLLAERFPLEYPSLIRKTKKLFPFIY